MTILEQLQIVNQKFDNLHRSFTQSDSERSSLNSKFAQSASEIRARFQRERDRVIGVKEDVLKYYRIAKDNSRKDMIPHDPRKRQPDIGRLNSLVEQININSRDDYIAGQIIELASGYVSYLDDQISDVDKRENEELRKLEQDKAREGTQLSSKKKSILSECQRYLGGEDVRNLAALFNQIHDSYEVADVSLSKWNTPQKRKKMMLLGYQQYALNCPQILCATVKQALGSYFDEQSRQVNCPLGFTTDSCETIQVEYTNENQNAVYQGIQALILNYLRYFPTNEYKVSLFDYVHYNAALLGPLSPLASAKRGIIEQVPFDEKGLRQSITALAEFYRKIEARIGVDGVYSYNKRSKPENRIPFRIIIINKQEAAFRSSDEGDLAYLVNNAERFGIVVFRLTKSAGSGSKGNDREEQKRIPKGQNQIAVICDSKGRFYTYSDGKWRVFKWLSAPHALPDEFINFYLSSTAKKAIGTKYFDRYKMHAPQKSSSGRRAIEIPFGVDDEDNVISCSFENETFAAYIMGAAGSGKSTLLHTIICGLLMNYHPDEVELWLLDFKMLEFKRYVNCRPPHVKYLLLEKSDDLVFDIIDQLTMLLDVRQREFSKHGWSKLTDVPVDTYMPAIFVIIDEFAQMSQILRETKGAGVDKDYTLKLENLLAKGRALGIKFIFASQTYTTGISGLTETACKQIQMRFALKNTPDEIKQTLTLSGDEITPDLASSISSLPAYETLFKWRDARGAVRVGRFKNMYTQAGEIEAAVDVINRALSPVPVGSHTNDASFIEKEPVFIDGNCPRLFSSLIPMYKQFESSLDCDEYDDSDILIYAGVPCSFNLVKPFPLTNGTSENILIAGKGRDEKVSVLLSILNSYRKSGNRMEMWAHSRASAYRKYKDTVFSKLDCYTDSADICKRISEMKKAIQKRSVDPLLVVCLGYEFLSSDFEIFGEDAHVARDVPRTGQESAPREPDLAEIVRLMSQCKTEEERNKLRREHNNRVKQDAAHTPSNENKQFSPYDAGEDVKWILKRASNYGVHFVFVFEQGIDFINLRMDENSFQHKILFSMSRDEATTISRSRKANELDAGICVYLSGTTQFTMRPHIYRGVPYNGWTVDSTGAVVEK